MATTIFPTKGNLIMVKRSLRLAKVGYDLLDRKRNVLIREMMPLIDKAHDLQGDIDAIFDRAYKALRNANVTIGTCENIARTLPIENSLSVKFRSVMGVEIPSMTLKEENRGVHNAFSYSNSMLDDALISFTKVKELSVKLAEMEESVYRLAYEIKKTQKRANALKNVVIPRYEKIVVFITESLEEKEREEFTRFKVIKKRKTRA